MCEPVARRLRHQFDLAGGLHCQAGEPGIVRGEVLVGVERPRGIMIMSVDPAGPGRTAGMHIGDVIAKWNGEPVHGVRDLARRLSAETVGQAVTVTYLRGGEVMTATLIVAERPSA